MKRFWIAVRFLVFAPIALLLIAGYAVAAIVSPVGMLKKEGRDTISRWWMSWRHWVMGKISTYDLIK
jgi:hypothetical protein